MEKTNLISMEPKSASSKRLALREKLSTMALEMEVSGRLKEGNSEVLIPMLIEDMEKYPEVLVLKALAIHRENSPFWPCLSDLMTQIKPELEKRERHELWLAKERETLGFMLEGTTGKNRERILSAFKQRGVEMEIPKNIETGAMSQVIAKSVRRL